MKNLVALTTEQISSIAPQIYTEHAYEKMSKKYSFIPTYKVIEDMDRLGWKVNSVKTGRYKDNAQRKHGKHMVQFFNPDIYIKNAQGGVEAYPQVLLINDSMGRTRLRFELGVFRMICENGMIVKSEDYGSIMLRHMGYSFEELQNMIEKIMQNLPKVVTKIQTYTDKIMTPEEQKDFALKAIQSRFGEEKLPSQDEIMQVLESRRKEDNGDNLWVVFNRVQESLIKGGFVATHKSGKSKRVRAITNMTADVELNKKLWEVAEAYV
jgi:hypothetical protein